MAVSVFDLFKIGIGPSSSHTVGPMKAACTFVHRLDQMDCLAQTARIQATLFGSLAHTGRGHGTDKAIMLGLQGEMPDTVDPDAIEHLLAVIRERQQIALPQGPVITFKPEQDLKFNKRQLLPHHPNGMRFEAFAADGSNLSITPSAAVLW